MALHEPGVLDAVIRRLDAHAAFGLLHDDREHEARVDARGCGGGEDAGVDVCDFGRRGVGGDAEVGAGGGHEGGVGGEHGGEGDPFGLGGPGGAVAAVEVVGVCSWGAGGRGVAGGEGAGDDSAYCSGFEDRAGEVVEWKRLCYRRD